VRRGTAPAVLGLGGAGQGKGGAGPPVRAPRKATFRNRYGITLAADLYQPKGASGKLAAIAVCGPFGAVKEQCSGLYAQTMAERGFLAVAFDPSFTGESGGTHSKN